MDYIYMNNFRGFSDTLIPLRSTTFLVGENSTGKSSFLKLIYLLSRPQFWFSNNNRFEDESELGGFLDIVSAWSPKKDSFQVGMISSRKGKKEKNPVCSFGILFFENFDGSPILSKFIQYFEKSITKIVFTKNQTKFKILSTDGNIKSENDLLTFFRCTINEDKTDTKGYRLFPKEVPPYSPLPIALGISRSLNKGSIVSEFEFFQELPFSIDLTWIAPIRSRPKRIYDGMRKSFSPEGDHTPFILKKALKTKSKSVVFAEKLKNFGIESGLFETIYPHSYAKTPDSPFEIIVQFSGIKLNVNNVGYGVSQVLPLVVEFLSYKKNHTFAVQQPEVHLHPKAQAALGDLIAELAFERGHCFLLETHSDYLIDRFRLNMSKRDDPPDAQVVFFNRMENGNSATILEISKKGKYPEKQPEQFRSFFIKEEIQLLEI